MNALKTILLVDPNDGDLDARGTRRLSPGQTRSAWVNDSEEGLDYLYRRGRFAGRDPAPPAAVLRDLKMPKVDGLAVPRTVKADSALKPIPIVMLASSREERGSSRAIGSA
ncbi:MAG: response regulator [Gammaproteobacteria bacterium]